MVNLVTPEQRNLQTDAELIYLIYVSLTSQPQNNCVSHPLSSSQSVVSTQGTLYEAFAVYSSKNGVWRRQMFRCNHASVLDLYVELLYSFQCPEGNLTVKQNFDRFIFFQTLQDILPVPTSKTKERPRLIRLYRQWHRLFDVVEDASMVSNFAKQNLCTYFLIRYSLLELSVIITPNATEQTQKWSL